jgi:hypothetical protein
MTACAVFQPSSSCAPARVSHDDAMVRRLLSPRRLRRPEPTKVAEMPEVLEILEILEVPGTLCGGVRLCDLRSGEGDCSILSVRIGEATSPSISLGRHFDVTCAAWDDAMSGDCVDASGVRRTAVGMGLVLRRTIGPPSVAR